eukprot:4271789-Heterocapsa_arctica.AAC.1
MSHTHKPQTSQTNALPCYALQCLALKGTPDVDDDFPLDDEETLDTDGDGIGDNVDKDSEPIGP